MRRPFLKAVLVVAVSIAAVRPAPAETIDTAGKQIYAGIAVVAAAAVIGIIFLVRHENHKTVTITGCIASGSLTDDKDKRAYTLSGDPTGIKTGERMTLKGKRQGSVFDAQGVIKDLGICQP